MKPLSLQQENIAHFVRHGRGSFIVVARAGTGKTFTIVNGIVHVIYYEQPRASVAVMAYNNSAGAELNERLTKAGLTNWKQIKAGTCHSFGFGAFRKAYPDVKVDKDKLKKIIAELAAQSLHVGLDYRSSMFISCKGVIEKTVSLAKQRAIGFMCAIGDRRAWYDLIEHHGLEDDLAEGYTVDQLVEVSIPVLQRSFDTDQFVIDFDDMILAPLVHKVRFWQYDYVIMDEAQDTNPARRALAMAMLKPRYGRFGAVGDDRQAIYGFTGADSDSLELIKKATNATMLPLTVTYRCPKAVVAMARVLVPDYQAHPDAPEGVVREVPYEVVNGDNVRYWYENENLGYGDAILCRNTKPLVEEAYALLRAGIGCMVEGREIGNSLVNLATRWKRIKQLSALAEKLVEHEDRERTKWLAKGQEEKADAVSDRVGTLTALISKLSKDGKTMVTELVDFIGSLFGDSEDADKKVVRLCTLHRSKGREWRRVFHIGRTKYLPSGYAKKPHQLLQEENLEYVGFTRAMEEYVEVVLEA